MYSNLRNTATTTDNDNHNNYNNNSFVHNSSRMCEFLVTNCESAEWEPCQGHDMSWQ